MTGDALVAALALPTAARVGHRVPKKLLVENGDPTAADKRQIQEGIEQLLWLSALKPATVGIAEYRDDSREYVEIAVLRLMLRPGANDRRLLQLVHRAVPYPVVLVADGAGSVSFSLAHKRWSLGEEGTVVIDGELILSALEPSDGGSIRSDFVASLPLARQPRTHLRALYEGWIDTVLALHVARLNGTFALPSSREHAAARRAALDDYARIDLQLTRLLAAAEVEKQMRRQVELNLELQRLRAEKDAARARL